MEISMNFEVRESFSENINTSKQTPKSANNDFKNVIKKNKSDFNTQNKEVKSETDASAVNESSDAVNQDVLTAVRRFLNKSSDSAMDTSQTLKGKNLDADEVLLEDLTEKIVDILEGFGLLNQQNSDIKLDKETLDYIFSKIGKDGLDGNEKTNNLMFGELAGTQKVSPNEINNELKELVLQYLSSLENLNDGVKSNISNGEVKANDGQTKRISYQGKEIDIGKLNSMVQKAVEQATGNGQAKNEDMDLTSSQSQNIELVSDVKQDSGQVQKSNVSFSETLNTQAYVSSEDISENLTKIVSRMSSHIADGKSEFDVELKPEFLGKVSIKLVSENGEMKALIKTGNNEARVMIADQLSMLNDSLKEKGLNVSSIDVVYDSAGLDMSNQNFLNQQNEQNGRKNNGNRRARQNIVESLSYDILPEIEAKEISVRNSSVEFSA